MALVHPDFSRSSSLERDAVLLAEGLLSQGAEVHCYCDPTTRTTEVPGVTFHDVGGFHMGQVSTTSRLAHPLKRATFAVAATRAVRRDRHLYDVVDVRQTAAIEGDVLQVHGVVAAMQARWSAEAGRSFRAARLRAATAPVVRPQVAVDRTIQRLQSQRGRFRRVIAVTGQVREDLINVHGVQPERIDVIPPPIDLLRIGGAKPSGLRERVGIGDAEILVLFVGNEFHRKGLDRLLEALASVPEARLVVVGEGDRSSMAVQLARTGLAQRVHFAGRVDEPERYYAEADLVALPTRSDPWGIPLIEAMAAGVPVVSTSMAGSAHVVASADAGIILRDESAASLIHAIRLLISDPDRRLAMGERGRAAAADFGVDAHAAAVITTYHRALEDANSRRD